MNTLKAVIRHGFFKEPGFQSFSIRIEKSTVVFARSETPGDVSLVISGRKGYEKLRKLFFELFELLFIYLGHYPLILSLEYNGISADLKDLINKYHSSRRFGRLLPTCDINAETINENALLHLRALKELPLFSLEYIVSSEYDSIIITHRLLLLLQAMEGLVTQTQRASVEVALKKITGKTGKEKTHKKAVFFICRESFFGFHRKYNCEILQSLGLTKKSFLAKATDTRNVYSHFYNPKPDEIPISQGDETIYFFEILFFATRIFLCTQLGIKLKDQNIRESYYRIHDWIMESKYHRDDNYKSWAYSLSKIGNAMQTVSP